MSLKNFSLAALVAPVLAFTALACSDADSVDYEQSNVTSKENSSSDACAGMDAASISEGARAFMKSKNLFKGINEVEGGYITQKWAAVALRSGNGRCHVVMNLVLSTSKAAQLNDAFEVIIATKTSSGVKFSLFEEGITLPKSLRVAIGIPNNESAKKMDPEHFDTSFYYAELTGASVIEALKSRDARLGHAGFSSDLSANVKTVDGKEVVTADGKASFDPTPNRVWKLKNSSYSLRRGHTPEIYDVQPFQLDKPNAFSGIYAGCDGKVASWATAFLRKIQDANGKWVEVEKPESVKAPQPVPAKKDATP